MRQPAIYGTNHVAPDDLFLVYRLIYRAVPPTHFRVEKFGLLLPRLDQT